MPRLPINYQNTIIYKICCNDVTVKEIYIGHTTDFKNRKRAHKCSCNNPNSEKYNIYVYQFIRDNGGFENWSMIEIEKFPCNDKYEAEKKERHWIESLNSTLNKVLPTQTKKEYYENNKEKIKQHTKEYRENNKEKIKQHKKEYRENNKEKIKQHKKEYREINKEKLVEERKKTFTCECGSCLRLRDKSRHEKSMKHQNYLCKLIKEPVLNLKTIVNKTI